MNGIVILVTFLISAAVCIPTGMVIRKKSAESKISGAENEAKRILEVAKKDAENVKKEEILRAKEEILASKNELDKEIRERRGEIQQQEKRIFQKEEALDRRSENFERKEKDFERMNQEMEKKKKLLEEIFNKQMVELQRISGLSKDEAKTILLEQLGKQLANEKAILVKEVTAKAKEEAVKQAREIIGFAIQKCAADHTSEATVSVVALPNDDMKGRIIGREGRNIRTIEAVTGVDLIIDDTPEAIVLSSFDPYRREIARVTLETLIKDGRIHPTRIEELYDKTVSDMKAKVLEYGNNALFELGITKMDPELVEILGKLHFRTSFGQNALTHSIEVGFLSGVIAAELGENVALARRAGLLHDIGKSIDHEVEGSHVTLGAELAKKYKENEVVINAIASHHGNCEAESVISVLVAIADSLSASRPGARNDSLENYVKRLQDLEKIATDVEGVQSTFAIQAGRELRVIVKPEEVDDLGSFKVARDIKERIENELQYPGTIKVVVIRETRATEEAK